MLEITLNKGKTFHNKLQEQTMKERQIWRQLLTQLLDVVKFLTKPNLSFWGYREVDSSNKGNFIELVELMSKYDPVLAKHHLKKVNDNRRYLSPKIQNEFTHILGNHAKANILDRIWKANYFAVRLNSTLDISHNDQVSFIRWYVVDVVEDKEVKERELFPGFITEHGKTVYDIKKMILDRLQKEKLNAASMAGVHGSVLRLNGKAKFEPCPDHSLNVCGVYVSAGNASDITFLGVFLLFQSPVRSFFFAC